MFEFTAENDDEINLHENDIITDIEQDTEDPGWSKGTCPDGKRGLFPDNFVKFIDKPSEVRCLLQKKTFSKVFELCQITAFKATTGGP